MQSAAYVLISIVSACFVSIILMTSHVQYLRPKFPVWSFGSRRSFASVVSTASVCSTLSVFSCISIFTVASLGSVGSTLSIGSIASVLSIGSQASFLSIASNGCYLGVHKNCFHERKLHTVHTEIVIRIDEEIWDTMAACTFIDYISVPRPARCDYQGEEDTETRGKVKCTFKNLTSGYNVTDDCAIRRKGHGSWRSMGDSPSFKIKDWADTARDEKIHFGTFSCEGYICPPGEDANVWSTKKVVIQNQVQGDGEVDAYDAFGKLVASPLAYQTKLKVYRGDALVEARHAVLLENADDKRFCKKWFGKNYILYERDPDTKVERFAGDDIEDMFCTKCEDKEREAEESIKSQANLDRISNLRLKDFNATNAVRYFAGEVTTNHWDGACILKEHNKNHYIAFDGKEHHYIPKGLDQTFQCPLTKIVPFTHDFGEPQCTPMKECFANTTCRSQYESIKIVSDNSTTRKFDCPDWETNVMISILIPFGLTSLLLVTACIFAK